MAPCILKGQSNIYWHYISILNELIMNFKSIINSDKNAVLYNTNVHAICPLFIAVSQKS